MFHPYSEYPPRTLRSIRRMPSARQSSRFFFFFCRCGNRSRPDRYISTAVTSPGIHESNSFRLLLKRFSPLDRNVPDAVVQNQWPPSGRRLAWMGAYLIFVVLLWFSGYPSATTVRTRLTCPAGQCPIRFSGNTDSPATRPVADSHRNAFIRRKLSRLFRSGHSRWSPARIRWLAGVDHRYGLVFHRKSQGTRFFLAVNRPIEGYISIYIYEVFVWIVHPRRPEPWRWTAD